MIPDHHTNGPRRSPTRRAGRRTPHAAAAVRPGRAVAGAQGEEGMPKVSATDARLTAADRTLLRTVFAWTRSNGWKREKPTRRKDGTRISAMTAWAEIRGSRSVWLSVDDQPSMTMHVQRIADGWLDVWVTSAREAVDILAALGVLPPELSSLWQAGRDAALTDDEWRVVGERATWGHLLFASELNSPGRAQEELEAARRFYAKPHVEHRRVGASEWERVQ